MTDWPSWKPNSVLKAAQLVALEDYLLTPWRFTTDFCAGVDSMRPESVVARVSDNNALTVSVSAVRGITAGGCPIVVSDSALLSAQTELQKDGSAAFDAFVRVNDEASPTKLALDLKARDGLAQKGEQLWLGRFSWDAQAGLRRTTRPPVRRLAALRADPDWAQWVAPVGATIKTLAARLRPPPQMEDSRLVASAVEAHRLRYEWPTLTIVALVRAARFLSWLGKPGDGEVPDPVQPEDCAQEQGSDLLPQRLASYFNSGPVPTAERLMPERDYRVSQGRDGITVTLSRALAAGLLELRFPQATFSASEPLTISAPPILRPMTGIAVGPELRFALPLSERGFVAGYRFDVLSNRLATPAPLTLELWHSKKNEV